MFQTTVDAIFSIWNRHTIKKRVGSILANHNWLELDVRAGGSGSTSRLGPFFASPPPNPCIWTGFIFSLYPGCLARKPPLQYPRSEHQGRHVATRLPQTSSSSLLPASLQIHHPPTPSAAPAVPLKTSCPMAWANMFGHLSCEPVEWQDPPPRKAHKTSRPPHGVTHNWRDNKPWSWLTVTF